MVPPMLLHYIAGIVTLGLVISWAVYGLFFWDRHESPNDRAMRRHQNR